MLSFVWSRNPTDDGTQNLTDPAFTVQLPWNDAAGSTRRRSPALSVIPMFWSVASLRSTRTDPAFTVESMLPKRPPPRLSVPLPAFIVRSRSTCGVRGRAIVQCSGPLPKPGRKNVLFPPLEIDRRSDAASIAGGRSASVRTCDVHPDPSAVWTVRSPQRNSSETEARSPRVPPRSNAWPPDDPPPQAIEPMSTLPPASTPPPLRPTVGAP